LLQFPSTSLTYVVYWAFAFTKKKSQIDDQSLKIRYIKFRWLLF